MKKECKKRKNFVVATLLLVLLASLLFIVNYMYYASINANLVGNGIVINILYMIANSLVGVLGFFAAKEYEEKGMGWLLFVISPLFVFLISIALYYNGLSVDGYRAWLSVGPMQYNYMQLLWGVLLVTIPAGIDFLIKKSFKQEELIFAVVTFVNSMILCFGTKDLQSVILSAVFTATYYIYRRRVSLLSIGVGLIPVACCVFQKMMPLSINEYYAQKQEFRYVYRYPLLSMKEAFSMVAVLLVIAIYVALGCVLWKYIKLFVCEAYKKRAKFFFYVVALISVVGTVLDVLPFESNVYGAAPFSTSEGFLVLIPIVMILLYGKAENK